MIYLIVFNTTKEFFEDTLYYFHCDIRENYLKIGNDFKEESLPHVFGVIPEYLNNESKFKKAFYFDRNDSLGEIEFRSFQKPDIVHFLLLNPQGESKLHRELSSRAEKENIKIVNPYDKGTLNCQSKFRTYEILKENNIPTPLCFKISRFNKIELKQIEEILSAIKSDGVFIQPEQGTEGIDCRFFKKSEIENIFEYINNKHKDLVIREKIEAQKINGFDRFFVLRINVTYDGEYHADSGYLMVGREEVVSADTKAERKNINEFLNFFEKEDINFIKKTACLAVEKIFQGYTPSLLAGVDLILENNIPYIIDVNPRPVVVGSRIIGDNKINLGENFWKGVLKRWNGKI